MLWFQRNSFILVSFIERERERERNVPLTAKSQIRLTYFPIRISTAKASKWLSFSGGWCIQFGWHLSSDIFQLFFYWMHSKNNHLIFFLQGGMRGCQAANNQYNQSTIRRFKPFSAIGGFWWATYISRRKSDWGRWASISSTFLFISILAIRG